MISLALAVVVLSLLVFVGGVVLALTLAFVGVTVFVGGSQRAAGAGLEADVDGTGSSLASMTVDNVADDDVAE